MTAWKTIPSHPGYEASDDGHIRNARTLRVFNGWVDPDGYNSVTIRVSGKVRCHRAHRLIAEAFLGICPEGHCVDHINKKRLDNRVANLRYLTWSANSRDGGLWHLGRKLTKAQCEMRSRNQTGEKHSQARLTEAKVREIRRLRATGVPQRELAKRFGVCRTNITMICLRKLWDHV
jgi:hypothetical protein